MKWMGLFAVILIIIAARLLFAFQTPTLNDDAYLDARHVQHILETGLPPTNDTLSWGGTQFVGGSLWHYLLALFSLIIPVTLTLKIVPAIFASLLSIPVFLTIYDITKKTYTSLTLTLVANFIPIYFSHALNTHAIVVPLFFWTLYCWLKLPEKKYAYLTVGSIIIYSFIHPSILIFMASMLLFIIFCRIEKLKTTNAGFELLLFGLAFALWAQFILYKNALIKHGLNIFWLNIPPELLTIHFTQFNIFELFWYIGFFPVFGGSYALYKYMFQEERKPLYALFSIISIVAGMLWLKIVELTFGLIIMGIALTLLLPYALELFHKYMNSTKFSRLERLFTTLLLLTLIITTIPPALVSAQETHTITTEEHDALEWIKHNTHDDATIFAPVGLGHAITSISERKNVIDNNYLLHEDAQERWHDTERVYQSVLETEVVSIFQQYNATHILIPPGARTHVFEQSACFARIYHNGITIYEKDPTCKLRIIT